MDFTGYKIFDIYGVERIPLVGNLDAQGLAHKLIDEWIPYFECEKCGRADYCKYTKPDKYRPERLADIKCGVIVEAITNFVRHTFPLLEKMTTEQVQAYLDGAFHLEQFLYNTEQTTGMFIDDAILRFFGDYAPTLFGRATHLREHLNKAASEFRKLPDFASEKGVLFVEGWAEKAFLEKLRESHSAWFLYLAVEVYEGRSNRRPNRIQMLLDRYVKQGYIIYIQGDADGKDTEVFRALCDKGAINPEHSFVFRHDFESAIPPRILYQALRYLGELEKVEYVDFEKVVKSEDRSVVKLLSEKIGIDVERLKLPLAEAVGDILNDPRFAWWQNEEFMETELGKFLKFTMHVR
jgi:hypothetical protein